MVYELTYRPLRNEGDSLLFYMAFKDPSKLIPEKEIGSFLVLQSVYPIYETVGLPAQSLKSAWIASEKYISSGCTGKPPLACYSIYLITVGDDKNEKVVYIGKTSSSTSRFISGHSAISKLHAPKYSSLKKRLYLCCVVFLSKSGNAVPIEWIKPYSFAESLLKSFEANLIFRNKPELNSKHILTKPKFEYGPVHVQNITGKTSFWHDYLI